MATFLPNLTVLSFLNHKEYVGHPGGATFSIFYPILMFDGLSITNSIVITTILLAMVAVVLFQSLATLPHNVLQ